MKEDVKSAKAPLIAIVDDDDSVRGSTHMLIRSFGYRAEAFARARDVLDWPLLDEAACLILDVIMPEMNGLELQRKLKQTHPRIPIIFITAHVKDNEARQAATAGAVAILRKPVAGGILFDTVCRALGAGGAR